MPTVPDIHRRGTRDEQATLASPPLTIGTLYFVTDEGVTERWDGSGWAAYSGAGTGVTPPPSPPGATPTTWLVSGGQVAWEAAYTFRVSAADYYINAAHYTSAEATVTLGAPHATLDRIDVIALNTAGAAVVIAGTAAATPSEPSVDPAAYLKLAIVFVQHATVTPPDLVTVSLYAEAAGTPGEWAWTSSGASIVVNSTSTPHAGTKTIEGTAVVAGVYAQGTAAAPLDPTAYDHLLLFLRSKAAWNTSRGLLVTLRLNGVLVGASVEIRRSGTYGFDSAITSSYQMVAIPIVAFAVPQGATIDQVRVEDFGGAIGFFLDDISLQAHATTPVGGGLTQDQADARYAPLVHAARHQAGGADPIALDTLAAPTDVTTLNATASAHGLLRKLSGTATQYLDGSGAWSTPATGAVRRQVTVILDGAGSAITTGVKAMLSLPVAGTWKKWRLLSIDAAATSGSIVIDIWKDSYANYPPTVADTITAAAKPTVSSANKAESSTLTGWTTTFVAGEIVAFNVDSVTALTKVALYVEFE
jgi:hypothetical protein